jgi:hypothetical protein
VVVLVVLGGGAGGVYPENCTVEGVEGEFRTEIESRVGQFLPTAENGPNRVSVVKEVFNFGFIYYLLILSVQNIAQKYGADTQEEGTEIRSPGSETSQEKDI